MSSGDKNGKMSSSGTSSPLVARDGEIPENVGDDVVVGEQEEPLEQNVVVSGEEAAASPVNPLSSDAAQILPLLQNLLVNNNAQRERLSGLMQLYDPTAQDTNANVTTTESEQIAREAALSSLVHFLEQSVQRLEEELENQKQLNAQLEEQIQSLTTSSDP